MALAISPALAPFFGLSGGDVGLPTTAPKEVVSLSAGVMDIYLAHNRMHKKMRKKEKVQHQKRTFRGHFDSSYQQFRSAVVDWITRVGEACNLKNLTIHAAMGFVDMVLDLLPVDKSRLQLLAVACILIAAKIEEQEENIPRITTLNYHCGNVYPKQIMLKMESLVLNYLKWEVVIITPINFLEFYLQVAFNPGELANNPHIRGYADTNTYLMNTAEFFVDLCQHQSFFREYLPSVVAAASIAVSRHVLKIQPVWSPALQLLTGYSPDDIAQCSGDIWSYYNQTFPTRN